MHKLNIGDRGTVVEETYDSQFSSYTEGFKSDDFKDLEQSSDNEYNVAADAAARTRALAADEVLRVRVIPTLKMVLLSTLMIPKRLRIPQLPRTPKHLQRPKRPPQVHLLIFRLRRSMSLIIFKHTKRPAKSRLMFLLIAKFLKQRSTLFEKACRLMVVILCSLTCQMMA